MGLSSRNHCTGKTLQSCSHSCSTQHLTALHLCIYILENRSRKPSGTASHLPLTRPQMLVWDRCLSSSKKTSIKHLNYGHKVLPWRLNVQAHNLLQNTKNPRMNSNKMFIITGCCPYTAQSLNTCVKITLHVHVNYTNI